MDKYSVFSKRLKERMNELNISSTDLANKMGINRSFISMYINEKSIPRSDKITLLAKALGTTENYLLGYESDYQNMTQLPIIGYVAAGGLEEQFQQDLGYVEVPKKYANKDKFIALKISGDSMDKIIPDGSIAIFEKNTDFIRNKVVLSEVNGKTTVKLLEFPNDDYIMLSPQSSNMSHRPIIINKNEENQIKIYGKLSCIIKEFN